MNNTTKLFSAIFGIAALVFFGIGGTKAYLKEVLDSADYMLIGTMFALASTIFTKFGDSNKG